MVYPPTPSRGRLDRNPPAGNRLNQSRGPFASPRLVPMRAGWRFAWRARVPGFALRPFEADVVCDLPPDVRGYTGGPPRSVLRDIDCCRSDHDNLEGNNSPRTASSAKARTAFRSATRGRQAYHPPLTRAGEESAWRLRINGFRTHGRKVGSRGSNDRAESL